MSQGQARSTIVIKGADVFDGVSERFLESHDVLVEGNLITSVDRNIPTTDATVIDGSGRTLMPGLIDSHWHSMLAAVTIPEVMTEEADFVFARTTAEAQATLMRGFTTVRDIGGPVFGLKRAIDRRIVHGPRILPSGAMISQTSGHFDFSCVFDLPRSMGGPVNRLEQLHATRVADGVPEVLAAVRMNLKGGASQIKIAGGGGVASVFDPLDVTQYRDDEMRAAVDAARDFGTYVAAHLFRPAGIKRAVEAGVRSIEHGHGLDEESASLMAQHGVWLVIQPFFKDDPGTEMLSPEQLLRHHENCDGFDTAMRLAKEYRLQLGFGTDLLFSPEQNGRHADMLARFGQYLSNIELLRMITSENARLLEMSGLRHPYREGPLGVIRTGAYADLLLVDGNPLDDLSVLGDAGRYLSLIIKDGDIIKDVTS